MYASSLRAPVLILSIMSMTKIKPTLTLVRGLPGSGKSTLAKRMIDDNQFLFHFEADQFFVDSDGNYNWDGMWIGEAHVWCQKQTDRCLDNGFDAIVSNTFTRLKELRPYFELAKKYGIVPQIILCQGKWGSIHGVPDRVMENMRNRFEYDVSELYKIYSEPVL